MDAVQRLRSQAYAKDNLKSSKEQKVTVKQEGGKQIVAVEPAEAGTVYVPYYDPAAVYGEWPYPDYPPYPYYVDEAYFPGAIIGAGIIFGTAYAIWRWNNRFWGGNINWNGGRLDINRGGRVEHWRHNPQHRRGVAYNNANVRQQFAGNAGRQGNRGPLDFRGRDGKQVLNPGRDRTKAGDKRPGNRNKAADGGRTKQARAASQRSHASRSAHQRSARAGGARNAARGHHRASTRVARGRGQSFHFAGARGGRHMGSRSFGFSSRSFGGRGFGGRGFGGRSFGGRGGGGFRGGGRRSDVALKHAIVRLGYLDNGVGFYRFQYNGSRQVYVGVLAQDVQRVEPQAVVRGQDGYLRVYYEKLGVQFQTYRRWMASGGLIPRGKNFE
jgi:hypothetical protein